MCSTIQESTTVPHSARLFRDRKRWPERNQGASDSELIAWPAVTNRTARDPTPLRFVVGIVEANRCILLSLPCSMVDICRHHFDTIMVFQGQSITLNRKQSKAPAFLYSYSAFCKRINFSVSFALGSTSFLIHPSPACVRYASLVFRQ